MSKNLNNLIEQKIKNGEKLLSVFVTAGFPELNATTDIILNLADSGVDFVELGLPFSDPIADGPVIQAASQQALQNGFLVEHLFEIINNVRQVSEIPILIMGYLNPVFKMGIKKFLNHASLAKADGLIIPDWPVEESEKYFPNLKELDLDLIQLIAPNCPITRIWELDSKSTSFLYCVAYAGVTGQTGRLPKKTIDFFNNLRKNVRHPIMIGFGIKNRQDFLTYSKFSDGVIVGSAFLRLLQKSSGLQRKKEIRKFVKNFLKT